MEAALPAITAEPKEFTEDCITTLEIENTKLCSPAGRPTLSIASILSLCMRICLISRCRQLSVLTRLSTTNMADMYCETDVAMATPATPNLKFTTVITLSITFIMPAMVKNCMGRLVSPTARSAEAPKLYTINAGIPVKYIRIYSTD